MLSVPRQAAAVPQSSPTILWSVSSSSHSSFSPRLPPTILHKEKTDDTALQWLQLDLELAGLDPTEQAQVHRALRSLEQQQQQQTTNTAGVVQEGGTVEFLRLWLRMSSSNTHNGSTSTEETTILLLAMILHSQECMALRTQPLPPPSSLLQLPLTSSSSSSSSSVSLLPTTLQSSNEKDWALSHSDDFVFPPQAIQLAQAATQLQRAELLAELLLRNNNNNSSSNRNPQQLQSFLLSMTSDWRALAIRCVASLHRVQQSHSNEQPPLEYRSASKQALHVYASLASRMGWQTLSSQLQARSFASLYPRQYRAATSLIATQSPQTMCAFLESQITHVLQQDPLLQAQLETLQITARVKEAYSYWKKLLAKKKTTHNLLPDAVALRVIVQARRPTSTTTISQQERDETLCYYIHHVLQSFWPPSHNTTPKDYIAHPKPNGYQSLHHTSQLQGMPFEIQVRSLDMHRRAEFGPAAHADYKLLQHTVPTTALVESKESSAAAPLVWQPPPPPLSLEENDSYIAALERTRTSLVQQQVFCFVIQTQTAAAAAASDGDDNVVTTSTNLIAVPVGTPLSQVLAESCASTANHKTDGSVPQVWKNGLPVVLPVEGEEEEEEVILNGDVVWILLSPPSTTDASTNQHEDFCLESTASLA